MRNLFSIMGRINCRKSLAGSINYITSSQNSTFRLSSHGIQGEKTMLRSERLLLTYCLHVCLPWSFKNILAYDRKKIRSDTIFHVFALRALWCSYFSTLLCTSYVLPQYAHYTTAESFRAMSASGNLAAYLSSARFFKRSFFSSCVSGWYFFASRKKDVAARRATCHRQCNNSFASWVRTVCSCCIVAKALHSRMHALNLHGRGRCKGQQI